MLTLRLTQTALSNDQYNVEAALDDDGRRQSLATSRFTFTVTAQDREDMRWYLEDYLQYPLDPAPAIAARIESRMADMGTDLFRAVFESSETARRLWARLQPSLADTRIEIITEIREATAIPWELLRDPLTCTPLALEAAGFVRTQADQARTARPLDQSPLEAGESKIRILLAICRPRGREDVPFRSVASRILRSLSQDARDVVQLDVLRPATFEQLAKTLRAAKRAGQPYHVLHFDGHGTYMDMPEPDKLAAFLKTLGVVTLGKPRAGRHGYVLFENPQAASNAELVDGDSLGKLMVETGVPVLVLNACQSAFAQTPDSPVAAGDDGTGDQVRAFGSLAQEVMHAGAAGVVAMRYVLYVETAKRFVADLYDALVQGETLGGAVTAARKGLAANPQREIGYKPVDLQDWPVPIVYESAPIALFPRVETQHPASLRLTLDAPARVALEGVPPPPDAGFYGRDETLLALDRAFDTQPIVLLHAYAGSGKTTTAAEFARWYALTGGIPVGAIHVSPVLFTSFEQYTPLPRVLDAVGRVFEGVLEQNKIHWLALTDEQRKHLTLDIFRQIPVLWIWDNVEPVMGLPQSNPCEGSEPSQGYAQELADFLRAARGTKAKFLLTSRRDERPWLGELPRRVTLPPMPMQERVQLARALAEKQGRRLTEVEDWRPLLTFTEGNPLTLTVVVGQALRDGCKTRDDIERFVARLRAGESAFADEATEGRGKSLGASLSYGFDAAFTEVERKQLALLHFFQGFVDVDALKLMGHPDAPWCLPELRGLTREAGIALLDRAADVGLLTAHGGGYYSIHPALPWYFRAMFERFFSGQWIVDSGQTDAPQSEIRNPKSAMRSYAEAMGELANHYWWQYEGGNRDVIGALEAEQANLLHARRLARANGWWRRVISTMQGLDVLYAHTGRRAEWKALVDEIVPDLVDPATDGPRAGREEQWSFITQYRMWLAEEARQWAEAERLQRVRVERERKNAAAALDALGRGDPRGRPLGRPPDALDGTQRNAIRTLAVSLEQLGHIQREQGQPDCVPAYEEAVQLYQRIGDRPAEAVAAFNLGHAYKDIPALRDLDKADEWYRRSLELRDERDRNGRARCVGQLGYVAWERFKEARTANKPTNELTHYLTTALNYYHQALDLLPPDAVDDLAVTHNQLGLCYQDAGDLDRALTHYREAIRYDEMSGNTYEAAKHRRNVALALLNAGRLPDALEYAQAALRGFATFGDRAAADIQDTQGLIERIQKRMSP
jgi:tetratricopeptide (TPR) repeat protein